MANGDIPRESFHRQFRETSPVLETVLHEPFINRRRELAFRLQVGVLCREEASKIFFIT